MRLKLILFISIIYLAPCGCTNDLSEKDRVSHQILYQFTNQMKKEGLDAIGLGGGSNHGKINLIDICFNIQQVMDISSARKLMVCSIKKLLNIINSNEEFCANFEKLPVTEDVFHISIIGLTQKPDICNFVQIVTLVNGKIYYEIHNEKPSFPPFTTIHEETFEEAKRILVESAENKCL